MKTWTKEGLLKRTSPSGDCLIWQGAKTPHGYGKIGFNNGPTLYVHRLMLELVEGKELREDEQACHHCDTPSCIQPTHLYRGSRATNGKDASVRERFNRKLNYEKASEIRTRYERGETISQLAEKFGVYQNTIWSIINYVTYRHVW